MSSNKKSFEELGGRKKLLEMTKVFYDKVYDHPWLGKFFKSIPQDVIESQQVDFLQGALGGEKVYCGKLPVPAHKHMFITEEVYELRSQLQKEALQEVGACEELIERINRIDDAFKSGLIKNNLDECEKRYTTDQILNFPNTHKKVA